MTARRTTRPLTRVATAAVAVAVAGLLAGCVSTSRSTGKTTGTGTDNAGNCVVVDTVVSPEKITLVSDLAAAFNATKPKVGKDCIFVRARKGSSGAAASLLAQGWPDPTTNGAPPVIWSPAASGWVAIVNQRAGKIVAPPGPSFMLTPLVIAMPRKMADALGYPAKPVGFKDIVALAKDPAGWAKFGHPEWGAFRLGKTNPNLSTSGLNFTIAEHYAATGTSRDLSAEELDRPDVNQFVTDVESSVVHYGDTTLTFLNNWYRADARGTALTYTSAVAVEEKSVIDYNSGNPDGELSPGETPRPPREPLVAIYPSEGTLFSDSPFVIVDAPWVSPVQKQGAELFRTFVLLPDNQRKVLQSGFRPGNTQVPLATPIIAANGVDPTQPQAVLDVPKPDVLVKILDKWATQRKTARVMLVMDVSGSMGDEANPTTKETKLDLAKRAAISALDQFKDDDEVGLRIFSTGLDRNDANVQWLDLLPVSPIGAQREGLRNKIRDLVPVHGTPLYDVTASAYTAMTDGFDAKKINAVVLLTDGKNEDGTKSDDAAQLSGLLQELQVGSEGADTRPVRIFPIAYGKDADMVTLRQIAEATAGAVYDASNPNTIEQVFTAVVSNF